MICADYKRNNEPDWAEEKSEGKAAATAPALIAHYDAASDSECCPYQEQESENLHAYLPPTTHLEASFNCNAKAI